MKIIKKNQTQKFQNNPQCTAYEYPMEDPDINGAVIHMTGRYPTKGWAINTKSKEMVYVITGSGELTVEEIKYNLNQGDLVLIYPEEKYFFDGNFELFIPCTPAWTVEQHKEEN
jgi:mannose-6-phosphate isomerase-like protein (cupin superfamily)